jgi:hypothetical protein
MRSFSKFRFATLLLTASIFSAASPAHQRAASFQNAGLTLHYTIEGTGTPVVILASGPGMDAAYMQPALDQFMAPLH